MNCLHSHCSETSGWCHRGIFFFLDPPCICSRGSPQCLPYEWRPVHEIQHHFISLGSFGVFAGRFLQDYVLNYGSIFSPSQHLPPPVCCGRTPTNVANLQSDPSTTTCLYVYLRLSSLFLLLCPFYLLWLNFLMSLPCCLLFRSCTALNDFIKWCNGNFLDLNVIKTKELIADFRNDNAKSKNSQIHGKQNMKQSKLWKHMNASEPHLTLISNLTKTESLVKQEQRIHLMQKLNSFSVSKTMLLSSFFYWRPFNILFYFWFNGLSVKDENSLNRKVKSLLQDYWAQLNRPGCSGKKKRSSETKLYYKAGR